MTKTLRGQTEFAAILDDCNFPYNPTSDLIKACQPYDPRKDLTDLVKCFPNKSHSWYIGQIMKISHGRANPTEVRALVKEIQRGNNEVEDNG